MDAVSITDDQRLYVIGDIHGRSDLLDEVIQEIGQDLVDNAPDNAIVVTLGDYVDRGPDSRGVLDRLARNPFPIPYVALKGNHEELFELFLEDPGAGSQWRLLGGLETLHSYGVPVGPLMRGKGFEEASDMLRARVPPEHLAFLSSLRTFITSGQYFLCHAGVRPGVPLDRQESRDLLWIRGEFLTSSRNFGRIVVHGHTPVEQPQVLANRINIDTGAFATGCLTCIVLERGSHRFLTARKRLRDGPLRVDAPRGE
jgi:serine/threonine protein phosphatase 1